MGGDVRILIAALSFAFFVVCPRMAGITSLIAKSTGLDLIKVTVIGTLVAIPLVVAMVLIFSRYGLIAALAFAVLTDFLSALAMKEISPKAGIETLVIALFVLIGAKVATYISKFI
ncbi:hypothetical protein [Archaeoglobus profundus]|uniref:Uncharacterized protein n=1 Tax=Archaeoglobus profundus (strain DSM 5631 / JCM 9629 / NBRC 100127 / Av18) TaxID=572546 RepID=D2RFZ9_ARCPA|nr:hypothetical protein [Archaeoglobus profundus]ADB57224.1 hypothetical protein Arcpr_0152 [Archaeoglobus profundus DSM 5631]